MPSAVLPYIMFAEVIRCICFSERGDFVLEKPCTVDASMGHTSEELAHPVCHSNTVLYVLSAHDVLSAHLLL